MPWTGLFGLAQKAEPDHRSPEGAMQFESGQLVMRNPTGFRRLPIQGCRRRQREPLRHVDDDGPVRPAAMVVLMDLDDAELALPQDGADLLGELSQGSLDRRLVPIQRTSRNRPTPTLMAPLRPPSEEVPPGVSR